MELEHGGHGEGHLKSDGAEEGEDEVKSAARTDSTKKMSPLKTDFETPQMRLCARPTGYSNGIKKGQGLRDK